MAPSPQYDVDIFDKHIPLYAEAEIDRLYGARYASLVHLSLYAPLAEASSFVARRDGDIVALLLFVRRGSVVRVLNEGMAIDAEQIALFARTVFARPHPPSLVHFEAVETAASALPCAIGPVCATDTAMPLAATGEAWLASLGSNTRSNLRRYLRRLQESEPSFVFELAEREQVAAADVRAIVRLNRLRMAHKNIRSGIDDAEENAIIDYVRHCGFVGIVRIGGKLAAGVILYRQGKNFTLRTLGHEEAWSALHLGLVCSYLTFAAAMPHGAGGTLYFGWGSETYKFRFGARRRPLRRVLLYRSPLAVLRHLPLTLRSLATGAAFALRARLLAMEEEGQAAPAQWLRRLRMAFR